jgi:hypothetical protein
MDHAGVADIGFAFGPLTSEYFSEGLKPMVGACIHRRGLLLTGCLIPALFALAGCGSGLATVTGKVTVDGQPVSAGRVVFRTADGTSNVPVIAKIATDGSYRALDVPQGAMNVTVDGLTKFERIKIQSGVKGKKTSESKARAAAIESSPKIPEKYQNPDASGLTFTVKGGTNTYNIEIQSK